MPFAGSLESKRLQASRTSLSGRTDRFVANYLTDYAVRAGKTKFVHDPLWGTIEIAPHEQCFLDTPLLQRLRHIHQTGNVYATYPSATHTRFEHTLGVMHLAGRIVASLRKRYQGRLDKGVEQKVRMAALMHDVGHSAFSHTTEEIYQECSDMKASIGSGGPFQGKGAGEVLSYLVATSTPFRDYYKVVQRQHPELTVAVDDFAPLILGRAADPRKQYEADIISGAFDADKLDYFPRDGRAAGLEMSLDIDRLLHCLEIVPQRSTTHRTEGGKSAKAMVVSYGGFNAIQQLLFARATLFSSVYHHHKVRACDCMVKACFEHFVQKGKSFGKRPKLKAGLKLDSAADYLFITDNDYFNEASNQADGSTAHSMVHSLLYRRLLKRALTVSAHTLVDFEDNQEQQANYRELYNLRKRPEQLRAFAASIHEKSGAICECSEVWLDIPAGPSFDKAGRSKINVAPRNSKPKLKRLAEFIPVQKWIETYEQYYTRSYLFGPADCHARARLAEAGIRLLREKYSIELNEAAIAEDIRDTVTRRLKRFWS
jgi:uncharacterized protein